MRTGILLLMLFLQVFVLQAKETYKFRTLSPEGGFYYDGVKSIQQDKDGFIWVLMDNELYRFDGHQYRRYHTQFTQLDPENEWSFSNMALDSLGHFFVNTNNGIYLYDKNKESFSQISDIKTSLIKIDGKNNLWVRINKQWQILNTKNNSLTTPLYDGENLSSTGVTFCTNGNDLYQFSSSGKIYHFNPSKNEFSLCFTMPENSNHVLNAKIHKGKLWVLVQKSRLYKIDLSTFTIEDHFDFFDQYKDINIRTFFIDKNGQIWVGTINGLYIMDPDTKEYKHYMHSEFDPFSIPHNSIWTINDDLQKNIWIGTYSGGLCYINLEEENAFRTFTPQQTQLSHIPVSAFAEDKQYLWIGTEGGGINRMDKKTEQFSYYSEENSSLSYNHIKSIVVDKEQNLWIAMYTGGLNYFNTKNNSFKSFKHDSNDSNSLLSNDIRKIILEADSGLWIAYQQQNISISFYSFNTKKFTHYNLDNINYSDYVFDILRGRENQLWILSPKKLYLMDIKNHTIKEAFPKSTAFMNFRTCCMDDSGNLWIGTIGNGLVWYNPNTDDHKFFKELLKLDVYSIYCICYDNEGNLWAGTDNGLIRYNIAGNTFLKYDKKDGAQGQIYYPLSCMKDIDGNLYFGGTNGFTIINPQEVTCNAYKPHVIISDFMIDHKSSKMKFSSNDPSKNEIVLKYDQSNFGFKFSSDNYLIPEKNHFKYRLKGYDDRWIEVDATSRTALYSKVPAGTYYFEVLTANNDGIWNDTPTIIKIKRLPAPWLSWPAYMAYCALIFFIAYMILRHLNERKKLKLQLYMESIEKDKQEQIHETQLLFFTNISHDFRTPLSLITAAIDRLREEGLKEYYYRILSSNTQRLLNLVNELMDFRTIENGKMKLEIQPVDDFNLLLDKIADDFSDYAKQRQIDFRRIYDNSLPAPLYTDKNILEKIIMNLLNNAFKYTKDGGSVSLETIADSSHFTSNYENSYTVQEDFTPQNTFAIVVRDSGVGISKESIAAVFERFYKINTVNSDAHLGTGIGLALVKSLVLLHKGSITIYSERNKGTDMVIRLPLDTNLYNITNFTEKEDVPIKNDLNAEAENTITESSEIQEKDIFLKVKKRILFAEDNEDLRELIAKSLSDEYEVIVAANGQIASQLIQETDFDLIISDIMMPLKDGVTLCNEVKSDINTSHIPFILLTAKTSIESKIEGVGSGADMYFEKPVDTHFLKLSIQNIFKHQQQLKEYYSKNYFADSAELSSNQQDNKFLKKFIQIIEKNMDQPEMDVNYIASELSMSRSKLYTKIKSLTDKSIVEFILNQRLRKAAKLIIEEDMNMREVMNHIGIESQAYFTNAFKKEFGETPTSFASKHKKTK